MRDLTADQHDRVGAYAAAVAAGAADEAGIAQACGVPAETVMADLADRAFAAALDAALSGSDSDDDAPAATMRAASLPALFQPRAPVTDAEAEPGALALQARRVTAGLLQLVDEAVQAGTVDVDDAAKLLPRVHQVHADHARLEATREDTRKLPTFNIVFTMGSVVAQPVGTVEEVAPTPADFVDLEPDAAGLPATQALPGDCSFDALLQSVNTGLAGSREGGAA